MDMQLHTHRMIEGREISFSASVEEHQSNSSSRDSSPSIAVQNASEIIERGQNINASPMRKSHAKYLAETTRTISIKQCNQMIKHLDDAKKCKENQRRNIIPLKNRKCNDQNKLQIITTIKAHLKEQKPAQPIFRTPLKDKSNNQQKGSNYSNMSSIKDEKLSTPFLRQKPKEISQLHSYQVEVDEYERLSSSDYNLLSERYSASRTARRNEEKSIVKGKDVNSQIQKLQKKIDELQQMKKSMNIDFKDNQLEKTESRLTKQSTAKGSIIQSVIDIQKQESSLKNRDSTAFSKMSDESLIKSQLVTFKQRVNEEDIKMPRLLKNHSIKKMKVDKQIKSTRRTAEFGCPEQFVDQLLPKAVPKENIGMKTVKPPQITAHYSKVTDIKDTSQLRRLLSSLQNQIKLDEKLRKTKKWFQRWRYELKWNDLQSAMQKSRIKMSSHLIKQIFTISSQEQNPFYTPMDDDFTLVDLLTTYEQSQRHWHRQIKGQYSSHLLSRAQFTEQKMDISKRGIISIQDIVRYINFQLDTVYRNRDIYLIFHRFKKTKTLLFEEIIQCLTQQ